MEYQKQFWMLISIFHVTKLTTLWLGGKPNSMARLAQGMLLMLQAAVLKISSLYHLHFACLACLLAELHMVGEQNNEGEKREREN